MIFLSFENPIKSEQAANEGMLFEASDNYYFSFFKLLTWLLPHQDLSPYLLDFKSFCETNSYALEPKHTESHLQTKKTKRNWDEVSKNLLSHKKRLFGAASLLILCLGAFSFFFIRGKENNSIIQGEKTKLTPLIRSDLIVPKKSVLLHRPELLNLIDEKFKGTEGIKTVALVGMGGAGKTTLARQYAYQQKAAITWEINAETEEHLKEAFEKLALALSKTEEDKKILQELKEIKNPSEKEEKLISFVRERLNANLNWLLIYDNVERFVDIQKYFPRDAALWGQGKILITTKDNHIQSNRSVNHMIYVDELTPSQKFDLFTKIMYEGNQQKLTLSQKQKLPQFLENLPSFPLDVSISAFYLRATNIPFAKYLKHLEDNNSEFSHLQVEILKETGDYVKTRCYIINLATKELVKSHKDFKDLLILISLINSQHIPKSLLDALKNDVVADNFIYHLKKYSLIMDDPSSSFAAEPSYSIHRSTQKIILSYLVKTLDLREDHPAVYPIIEALEKYTIEAIDKEDLAITLMLQRHYEKLLSHNELLTPMIMESLEGNLGFIYFRRGDNIKARKILEKNLSILSKKCLRNPHTIARILTYLGFVHTSLGNYNDSRDFLEKSLIIYQKYSIKNHIEIARTLGCLGNIYRKLGNYEKAKDILEQTLSTHRINLYENHIGTALNLTYLGNVYQDLGHYQKARDQYEKSLKIYKKLLPKEHTSIAWTLGCLGSVYRKLGNYQKAKESFEKSSFIFKKCRAENHMSNGWALINLASIYHDLGDFEKAKAQLEQAFLIYQKYFPKDHIRMIPLLVQYGDISNKLGKYTTAKAALEMARKLQELHFGKDHIQRADILNSLGENYFMQGQKETAEKFFQQSLKIFQQNNHPDSYRTLENLADLYISESASLTSEGALDQSVKLKEKAMNYLKQSLEILKASFSEDSPHIKRIQLKLNSLK